MARLTWLLDCGDKNEESSPTLKKECRLGAIVEKDGWCTMGGIGTLCNWGIDLGLGCSQGGRAASGMLVGRTGDPAEEWVMERMWEYDMNQRCIDAVSM